MYGRRYGRYTDALTSVTGVLGPKSLGTEVSEIPIFSLAHVKYVLIRIIQLQAFINENVHKLQCCRDELQSTSASRIGLWVFCMQEPQSITSYV